MMFQRLVSQVVLPVLIIALGAGGLIWLSAKDAPPERTAKQPPPLLVETISLQADESSFPLRVSGNVVSRREVTLSAEVAGAVILKGESVESGRYVQKGDPLLQIDPARFELAVKQFGNELTQVAADLEQLKTEEQGTNSLIKLAEREAEIAMASAARAKDLALKNAASETQLESAERADLQARIALTALLNRRALFPVRRARLTAQQTLTELRQQLAQLNLDRTRIVAPFTGVITADAVEQGNYVQAGDVLLKLDDTSAIDVECNLRLDDLYWLWNAYADTATLADSKPVPAAPIEHPPFDVGKLFEVPEVDAVITGEVTGRKFRWSGRLARYAGGGVHKKTRTVACRVVVSDPIRTDAVDGPPTLMRGMHVTVTLNVTPRIRLLSIPTRGVQPNGRVWTVEDGVLRGHSVKPAKQLPDRVLVRADSTDLKPGDHVVITQLTTPLDGSRVREVSADGQSASTTGEKGDSP